MPIQEKITTIHALINTARSLAVQEDLVPKNYPELQQAALEKELADELVNLEQLLPETSKTSLKAKFLEFCKRREEQNTNTYLSYTSIPDGICNALYWNIAKALFAPKNLRKMIKILMPSVNRELELDFVIPSNLKKISDTEIKLHKKRLSRLRGIKVAESAQLAHFIVKDNVIFDLEQITNLPLSLHRKLKCALDAYPQFQTSLYVRNSDLRQLAFHISFIEQNGIMPKELITPLIKELTLTGTRYTGKKLAPPSATYAVEQFQKYLDNLPCQDEISSQFKKSLLQLKDNAGKTLSSIMDELSVGSCAETAAGQLKSLMEISANKETLNTRPNLKAIDLRELEQKYRKKSLSVEGVQTETQIPTLLRQTLLKKVKLTCAYDYITLLISLPASEYQTFLEYAVIECKPPLPDTLASALADDMLNKDQINSLLNCIIKLENKFGGKQLLLNFIIKSNNSQYLKIILHVISQKKGALVKALIKKNTDRDETILHWLVQNDKPETMEIVLSALSPEEQKTALFGDGDKDALWLAVKSKNLKICEVVLNHLSQKNRLFSILKEDYRSGIFYDEPFFHWIVQHGKPEAVQMILNALSQEDRLAIILKPNSFLGRIALHQTIQNEQHPEVLPTILVTLSPQNQLTALIEKVDKDEGQTMLHWAVTYGVFLGVQITINAISPDIRLIVCKEKNAKGHTALYQAATAFTLPPDGRNKNCEIMQVILNALSDEERAELIKEKNNDGKTILHWAIHHPDPSTIEIVLGALSKNSQLIVIHEKDDAGLTLIDYANQSNNATIKKIFSTILAQENQSLSEKNDFNNDIQQEPPNDLALTHLNKPVLIHSNETKLAPSNETTSTPSNEAVSAQINNEIRNAVSNTPPKQNILPQQEGLIVPINHEISSTISNVQIKEIPFSNKAPEMNSLNYLSQIATARDKYQNDSSMYQACDNVYKEGNILLTKISTEEEKKSLADSLKQVINVLNDTKNPEAIRKLKTHANQSAIGKPSIWKKFLGALSLLASAATATLSLIGSPATGGLSAIGCIGSVLLLGISSTLFYQGRQKSLSKSINTLCKAVERSNKAH